MITAWGKIEDKGDVVVLKIIYDKEMKEWLEQNRKYKGNLFVKIAKTTKERTEIQNNSLHLWLHKKTEQCREAGITRQMILSKTMELEVTDTFMKDIWRDVQDAMFKTGRKTRNLEKVGQIDEVYEHLNRFFAEKFNLPGTDWPHDQNKISNY
jgi:hypothetical protein